MLAIYSKYTRRITFALVDELEASLFELNVDVYQTAGFYNRHTYVSHLITHFYSAKAFRLAQTNVLYPEKT